MSVVLVHNGGYSIATASSSSSSINLPLSSRFAGAGAEPRATVAPSGHIFVYTLHGSMVWEYDSAGRRTGEMAAEGVLHVATLGNLLAVHGKEGVRVMKRAGSGKWACVKTLKVPRGTITAMAGDGNLLVICGDEILAYDIDSGDRVPVGEVETPVHLACVVKRRGTPCLVVSSTNGVTVVSLGPTSKAQEMDLGSTPIDLAVRDNRVAVLGKQSKSVTLASVDNSNLETVEFGSELTSVDWVNETTLVVHTKSEKALLYDLAKRRITPVPSDKPILAVHGLPKRTGKTDRVLSDSKAVNLATEKGRKSKKEEGSKNAAGEDAPVKRVVSAPALSQPLVTPSNPLHLRAASAAAASTVDTLRLRPPAIPEGDETVASPASIASPGRDTGPSWEAFEEMRKEIANLQMDMLRMGRGLKNEIRSSVAPLVEELRASRETIAKQTAELERLRRGF